MGFHLNKNDVHKSLLPKIMAEEFVDLLVKAGARHGRNDLACVQGAHDNIAKLVDCLHCAKPQDVEKYNDNHDEQGRFASGSSGGSNSNNPQNPAEDPNNQGPTLPESLAEDQDWEAYADASYGVRRKVSKRGARHSQVDLEKIKQAHDIMCALGAKCTM